jgi:outer membrane protein insertion porin family
MNTRASAWYAFLPWVSRNRLDPAIVGQDVGRILARYRNLGFLDAAVDTTVDRFDDRVHLRLDISEGEAVRVVSVSVRGLENAEGVDSAAVVGRLRTRPDRALNRENLEWDRELILGQLQNTGHAFATVSAEIEVDRTHLRARVTFRAAPGPTCSFGEVRVRGSQRVAEDVIRSGLTFRPGQPFRKREFLSSRKLLYRSGAFRSVLLGLPDSIREASPVDVVVSVSERKPRSIKLGGGYGTEEQLRASLSWQHRNFLGHVRQLRLEAEASALESKATLDLTQPYVWGSRTWLNLAGFIERARPEEVRVKRVGGSGSLERYLRDTGRLAFIVRADLVDFKADSTSTSFQVVFEEDTRDDFFNPREGYLVNLEAKESGFLFQSDHEFLKITAESRWYRQVAWRGVLALRFTGGLIRKLGGGEEIPNFERYFAGGANSVRGWSLNRLGPRDEQSVPVGGLSLLEGSVELRHRLVWNLGSAV